MGWQCARCVRVRRVVQVDASFFSDDVFDGHGWPSAESEKSTDGSQAFDGANLTRSNDLLVDNIECLGSPWFGDKLINPVQNFPQE